MQTLKLLIYYMVATKLPNSWWPGGSLFNGIRTWCLRGVLSIGGKAKIQKGVYIGKGNNISIGNNCQINENVRLDNVIIGDSVMIARETVILGKMHETADFSTPMNTQGTKVVAKTIVEDDVWFGLRVIVMPGLVIGKGCIIGAGSVVTKSTVPYGVYGGVPARLIRKRNQN